MPFCTAKSPLGWSELPGDNSEIENATPLPEEDMIYVA